MESRNDGTEDQRRDDGLRAVTVGTLQPHNATITLAAYDPDWPRQFRSEADRLDSALGADALHIEHVGSTSVPGLMAKPVLDVVLVVQNSADEPRYVPRLQRAGYVLRIREPDWFEHRLFNRPGISINLHVFSSGSTEVQRMLRFRDRLRADDATRGRYERVKRELAQRTWRHVQDYADAKSAVIREILDDADGTPGSSR